MGCKDYSSYDSQLGDKNASFMGSDHAMDSVETDRGDEIKIKDISRIAFEIDNAEEKGPGFSSKSECAAPDVCKVEVGGQCSEILSSAGEDMTSVSPSGTYQVESVFESMPEVQRKCLREIEQMEDRNILTSSAEGHTEGSDDDRVLCNKANEDQEQRFPSKELELKYRSVPDVALNVNCNKQEDGSTTAEEECSGGRILPSGCNKMDYESPFITGATKQCGAVKIIKDAGLIEGTNKLLDNQDAAPADAISCALSSRLLPDSILITGDSSCSDPENDLKVTVEIGGNLDVPPSLVMQKMMDNQVEQYNNNAGDLCTPDLEAPFNENDDTTADITTEAVNQVSLLDVNRHGLETGFSITESSLQPNFPLIVEKCNVQNSENMVESFRTTADNGRIDSETASVSGTNIAENVLPDSRRKGRDSKRGKKAQTKKSAAHPRKSSRQKQSEKNCELNFKCSKQKRSCASKPMRMSEWGSQSSTAQIFLQSNNLPFGRPPKPGPPKPQNIQGNEEHNKGCRNGHPEESDRKDKTSSGSCLRLKVKFGKSGGLNPINVTVTKTSDTPLSANDNGNLGNGSMSANCVKDKLQTAATREHFEKNNISVQKKSDKDPADSLTGAKLEKDKIDSRNVCGKLAEDTAHDNLHTSSAIVVEGCKKATENCYMDAETSPYSEVINSVPDPAVNTTVLSTTEVSATPADFMNKKEHKKKGLKKDSTLHASRPLLQHGSPLIGDESQCKKSAKDSIEGDIVSSPIRDRSSSYTCLSEELSSEHNSTQRCNELGVLEESSERGSYENAHTSLDLQFGELHGSKKVLGLVNSKNRGVPRTSKSKATKKGKSKFSESSKSRKTNLSGEGAGQQKFINRSAGKEDGATHTTPLSNCCLIDADTLKTNAVDNATTPPNFTNGEMVSGGAIESTSTDSAWVCCDDCFKWRRIPASLVDSIDETSRWTCTSNLDKGFADCAIPQEMSNEAINAELGIAQDEANAYDSDASNKEKGKGQKCKRLPGKQKAFFKAIKINQFLHRNRKAQTIDEIMVCHCKPPRDGGLGCGEECLNRMLNIECVHGTCPCGDFCSNQQFQKRKYVKFERFQSGKKGSGLRLLEDVRKGQFLIEYVGEVLDMQAYEARQKDYAAKGQKHFYFMTLNGNEVIDAGAKGNLGRFINHSCEPNCRTEKWMVNGEICVGIFPLRDIKKGEEVTFDYNYVRVFGAAAKRCYCGSLHCRGYIGGDSQNGDVIIQSDSDDESLEPVILEDEETDSIIDVTSRTAVDDAKVHTPENLAMFNGSKGIVVEVSSTQSSVSAEPLERDILPPLQPAEISNEDTAVMSVAAGQLEVPVKEESTITSSAAAVVATKFSPDSANAEKKVKHGSGEDKKSVPRARPLSKTSHSGSSKRDKGSKRPSVAKALATNKLPQHPVKSKAAEEHSPRGCSETIEGKLNELLDAEGGISKRKDSTKGYLKLLLLTAASRGNANNEGIQSNRDLSMILDALLKSKSRSVLMDVTNKNGLQMLHNIMKQYRRDFKKTPILRKLLKVLEYLAAREILTLEHIIRRPPCAGMESFKDSILSLTEHDDKQVHQIARNFRDRYIPKPFRRPYYMDREERTESTREPFNNRFLVSQAPQQYDHQSSKPTASMASVFSSSETVSVSEVGSDPTSSVPEPTSTRVRKRKSRWDQPGMTDDQKAQTTLNGNRDIQDDLPPGFSSPRKQLPVDNAHGVVIAQPQEKFLSRLPVSFGIPMSIVHEFGAPANQGSGSWHVAPGIPFQPFPPLPSVPRGKFLSQKSEDGNPNSSDETNSRNNLKRGFSSDIGKRYFRQQKWNVPPCMRNNNGWESPGNNGGGNTKWR